MENENSNIVKVVYADDSQPFLDMVEMAIPDFMPKYKVDFHKGHNGADLVRLVVEEKPHIILTDNDMPPGYSGIEAIKLIRGQGIDARILLTSGTPNLAISAEKIPNTYFLAKPYMIDDLERKIKGIWPEYF